MLPPPLLVVKRLSCERGSKQLYHDVTLSLRPHQCLHIIGSNGSGKTSLLKQLIGLVDSQDAQINWHTAPANTQAYGYLGHSDGLKPELTAYENLSFYARFYRTHQTADIDQILHDVGVLSCADARVKTLSFGQRRRVSLARLLLSNSVTWLLDEPLTGIDTQGRDLFLNRFKEHLESGGAIMLTHHQSLTASVLAPYLDTLHLNA